MGLSTSPGMAVATLPPRSSQSLRQRRESVRPGLSRISTRASTVEALETPLPSEPPPLGELADWLSIRLTLAVVTPDYILKKFNGAPPSLVLHLHPNYFRLGQQEDHITYDSPLSILLKHVQQHTVPHELIEELNSINVPWYDGVLPPTTTRRYF
jgi:transcription factor SPT20